MFSFFMKQELPLDHLIVPFKESKLQSVFKGQQWFERKCFEVAFAVMLDHFYICRKKVSDDYKALNERLQTLPDQLSYDIMVGDISQLIPHCECL